MATFDSFSLSAHIQRALTDLGFTEPTLIQEQALSLLLSNKRIDFHGQAQTGTGKTLAFGLPLIDKVDASNRATQALIVAPTRELVSQICDSLKSAARYTSVSIEPVYGGVSMDQQLRALRRGVHIVVGTPGRLNDHLRRGTMSLKNIDTLVLDEADIMLDMGFKQEIDTILAYTPADRQIWLFSATVKPGIQAIKRAHMKDPVSVRVGENNVTAVTTKQYFCVVSRRYRLEALRRFIDNAPDFFGLVFCRTKLLAAEVSEELAKKGYSVNALHGDMSQQLRNKVINGFKVRSFNVLIATDVAARGIDVSDLTHVINYSLPEDQESYVHRIGRTGRAGKQGIAITFANRSEIRRLEILARRFKTTILPLEVPSADEIATIRLAQAAEKIDSLCSQPAGATTRAQKLRALLQDRSQQELVNGMHNLLSATLLGGYNEHEEINFVSVSQMRPDTNNQEIMLGLGFEDGVTKGEVLRYLTEPRVVAGRDVGKIRIIKRRTFVDVPTHRADALVAALRGKSLRGKRVRVGFA